MTTFTLLANLQFGHNLEGQLVSTLPGISGDGSKAGAWDHLKAPSLTCLVADAGCQLEPSLGCRLGHLTRDSSMWSGLPCSVVAGLQGQAS